MQPFIIRHNRVPMKDPGGVTYELDTTTYTLPGDIQAAGTMVFLHDSLGCTALWRDFPAQLALAAGYHAFIYDRRGYGSSSAFAAATRGKDYMEQEADLLMELLSCCGIKDPVLFGHSDGGTIALLAAAKYPGQIKAVITEGAHVFVEDITIDGIEQVMEQFEHSDLPLRLARYHGDKTQAVFDAWTKTWLADFYRDWNIEHFLPQITCPVYVVQGEADEFGSIRQVQSITGKVSGNTDHFLIPNAGHSPHKQTAYFLIQKIVLFLEQQHLI